MTNLELDNSDAGFGVPSARERYAPVVLIKVQPDATPADEALQTEQRISPQRRKLFDLGQLALTGKELDAVLAESRL